MRTKLNNILHNLKPLNEVKIFTAMASILNGIPQTNAVFVKKTHGRAGWVSFSTHGQIITKEIADTLIVVYNRKNRETRISFLQAKYRKTPNIKHFLKISGADYYQWDLLKNRYSITSKGSIRFPSNILSFTCYKSITSYGIFYSNNNQIDMLYAVPCFLSSSNNNPVGKRPTTTLKLKCPKNCPIAGGYTASCHIAPCKASLYINNQCGCSYGKEEILTSCDIDIYERFLLDGYIGAPLNTAANDIKLFIYSLLVNANSGIEDDPIGEICKFLKEGSLTQDNVLHKIVKGKRVPLNILAIATGGSEKKSDYIT